MTIDGDQPMVTIRRRLGVNIFLSGTMLGAQGPAGSTGAGRVAGQLEDRSFVASRQNTRSTKAERSTFGGTYDTPSVEDF
jgi:hypothetical protein